MVEFFSAHCFITAVMAFMAAVFVLLFKESLVQPYPFIAPEFEALVDPKPISGFSQWTHFAPATTIALDGNRIFVGCLNGTIYEADAQTGAATHICTAPGLPTDLIWSESRDELIMTLTNVNVNNTRTGAVATCNVDNKGAAAEIVFDSVRQEKMKFFRGVAVNKNDQLIIAETSYNHDMFRLFREAFNARKNGTLFLVDPEKNQYKSLKEKVSTPTAVKIVDDVLYYLEPALYTLQKAKTNGKANKPITNNLPFYATDIAITPRRAFERSWVLDSLHPSPVAKLFLSKLSKNYFGFEECYCAVAEYDQEGRVLRSWIDTKGLVTGRCLNVGGEEAKMTLVDIFKGRVVTASMETGVTIFSQ